MTVLKNIQIKTEIEITGVTLLSIKEAKALPQHLKSYKDWWWLRSPGNYQDCATNVYNDGSVDCGGYGVYNGDGCVRPALKLKSSNLEIGDKFELGGVEFEVVSDRLAFCTGDIGRCAFRKDWKAEDANVYEASDVKRLVDDWFENAKKCCRKGS